ncbi:MAG: hypothetical protein B6229_07385 [Spirochaetaceae bacterium 4572_7]|nr:MAG: hypothetical protein B6229_07385 [Spirochaetaceae bacterium 4572_7]
MVMHPRVGFKRVIDIIDGVNPFLVVLSIVGLFCEYTSIKEYVLMPNQIISVIFVVDFVIRFISFDIKKYFFKGYGWVDFLASLPGFFFFLGNTPLLTMFKIVKIGRFFRIIRILRFLRVFNFLKKMKSDSTWVQDRIMQIGVTIVLVFVVGIIFVDNRVKSSFYAQEVKSMSNLYKAYDSDFLKLLDMDKDIVYYISDGNIYNRDGIVYTNYEEIKTLFNSDLKTYVTIPLTSELFRPTDSLALPTTGIIKSLGIVDQYQNRIMLGLLTTLLFILTIIIFYMGFVFAKDMQIIQLVIDSFDAGDDLLLKQEAECYKDENGELKIVPDESELISLLKVAANISTKDNLGGNDMLLSLAGLGNGGLESNNTSSDKEIPELISDLEYTIGRIYQKKS